MAATVSASGIALTSTFSGASVAVTQPRSVAVAAAAPRNVVVRAATGEESESVSRRMVLTLVAGVVAAGAKIAPAHAAYGESGALPSLLCWS